MSAAARPADQQAESMVMVPDFFRFGNGDPFDRMLIAQARADVLTLVSVDERFRAYDVDLLPLS